jgi:hypothetical protein
MIKTITPKWFAIGSLGLLAACSNAACDPNRAGFLDGIGCEASGQYQQRTATLSQGVAVAQANALEQYMRAGRAREDATNAQAVLATRRAELARYDRKLGELKQRLNQAAVQDAVDRNKVVEIRRQIASLDIDQSAARDNPMTVDLHTIQTRQEAIAKLLDDLD